jgi:arginine decarboxylase-like protein
MITASEIVGRMHDLIEDEGWIQHESSNKEGRCIVGALQDVIGSCQIEVGNGEAALVALNAIHAQIEELRRGATVSMVGFNMKFGRRVAWTTIPGYNDKFGRTVDEVLTLLDKARISLEEKRL